MCSINGKITHTWSNRRALEQCAPQLISHTSTRRLASPCMHSDMRCKQLADPGFCVHDECINALTNSFAVVPFSRQHSRALGIQLRLFFQRGDMT